jgi:hypothetical protein
MLKPLRLATFAAVLAGVVTAGCLFVSGQFVVTYNFKDHGYDPVSVNSIAVIPPPSLHTSEAMPTWR